MDEQPFIYHLIQYVGLGVAIIGAVIAILNGTNDLFFRGRARMGRLVRRRRNLGISSIGSAESFGNLTISTKSPPYPSERPIDERMQLLWRLFLNLEQRHNGLAVQFSDEVTARENSDEQIRQELSDVAAAIRSDHEAGEKEAAAIDGRGLIVFFAGMVLTNCPDGWASNFWAGLMVLACCLAIVIPVFVSAIRAWPRPPGAAAGASRE